MNRFNCPLGDERLIASLFVAIYLSNRRPLECELPVGVQVSGPFLAQESPQDIDDWAALRALQSEPTA